VNRWTDSNSRLIFCACLLTAKPVVGCNWQTARRPIRCRNGYRRTGNPWLQLFWVRINFVTYIHCVSKMAILTLAKTVHWCVLHSTQSKILNFLFHELFLCNRLTPLNTRFEDPYSSNSMSCEQQNWINEQVTG